MQASRVQRENYIIIQGWMVTDLKLKGNELLVYAIIYGFSQSEGQKYTGSIQYLADWTNSSKRGIMNALQSLEAKGFIIKAESYINNVKFCSYWVNKFTTVVNKVQGGSEKSSLEGSEKSSPNNIDIDNLEDNIERKEEKKKESFDEIIETFLFSIPDNKKERTNALLQEWLKVRKAKRAPLTDKAIELNLKKLTKTAEESNMAIDDYLEEVICRGWQAFYPINNYNNTKTEQPKDDDIFKSIADKFTVGKETDKPRRKIDEDKLNF